MGTPVTKFDLERLRLDIAAHLEGMAAMFTPDMMLTFVARHPANGECYVVVSSDTDLAEVAKKCLKDQGGRDAHEKGCNR
jgi:hypothetical protein